MVTLDHLAVLLLTRLLWTSLQAVMLVGIVALLIRLVPRLPSTARCTLWWLVGLQVVLGLCWQAPIRVPLLAPAPTVSIAAPQRITVATDAPANTAMSSIVETPRASGASASSQHTSSASTTKYVAGHWPVWLASLWILALLLQLPTIIMQRWRLRGLICAAKLPADRSLQIRCARAAETLELRRCPVVQVSAHITSPLVTGLWHPVILWPAENTLTLEESSLALAHELAHLQRGDLWWGIVPAVARWLFFFHPLVRRAVYEFALYREAACDAQVLQRGTAPHDYGSLLLRLGVAEPLRAGLSGASPTFHHLKRRLLMLEQTTSGTTGARGWLLVMVILVAALPYRVAAVDRSIANDVGATQIKLQNNITKAVAEARKAGTPAAVGQEDRPRSGNVEAYQLMLQGRALTRQGTEAGYRQGIALYQQALKFDPDYAYVWGVLANTAVNMARDLAGVARQQAYEQARRASVRQQALVPNAAATHLVRGFLLLQVDNDPDGALAEYTQALALAPNDATSMGFLAGGLKSVGHLQAAADLLRRAISNDPLSSDFYAGLANVLLAQGQLDAAEQTVRKTLVLQPDYPGQYAILVKVDILRDAAGDALRDAQKEADPVQAPWAYAAAMQISLDRAQADAALRAYIAKHGKDQPYLVADLYALRKQPDKMFDWLRRAWTQSDPVLVNSLLSDPFVLAYQHDARFAALCKRAGLPMPG